MPALVLLLSLASFATSQPAGVDTKTVDVSSFSTIDSCFPADVVVKPGESYSVELLAEADVLPYLTASVRRDTLYLGYSRSFTTAKPLRATVTMGAGALKGIRASSGGKLYVESGFSVSSLKIETGSGANVNVPDVDLESVEISSSSGSTVYLSKTGNAAIACSSGAMVFIDASSSVEVDASSGAIVEVDGTTDTTITGDVNSGAIVRYTDGTCDISETFPFTAACEKVDELGLRIDPEAPPVRSPRPEIRVEGSC